MKPKDEMELLVVEPKNYDRIIELSKTTREGAYSIEELEDMRAKGLALNHIVTIAFHQGDMYAPADLWEVKGTVDEVREVPDGIEVDFTIRGRDNRVLETVEEAEPEFVDNSVAYLGEDGTHGAYGIIGKAFGHQFCDITGCYGKRDDCKLK